MSTRQTCGVRAVFAFSWTRPVFAGDRITYHSEVTDKRASASRPQWGLFFHRNTGVNQNGEEVFSFDGCVFVERKPV